MARGRMISKTLGTSSRRFARLRTEHPAVGLFAQALYPLLVANADDWGRQKADPFTVKHSVWSTAPDDEAVFEAALAAMADVGLIVRYQVDGETYAQVVGFEDHQKGLHKRTDARMSPPPPSSILDSSANQPIGGKSVELPGNSPLREEKRRELNLREENRREGTAPPAEEASLPTARSKRPIFTGQRLTVFEWMFDDCVKTLGPYAEQFDLHEWFFTLDVQAVRDGLVVPKRDGGQWLQAQLVSEAQQRRIPLRMATAAVVRDGPKRCRHDPRCATDVACTARANRERQRPAVADVVPISSVVGQ